MAEVLDLPTIDGTDLKDKLVFKDKVLKGTKSD